MWVPLNELCFGVPGLGSCPALSDAAVPREVRLGVQFFGRATWRVECWVALTPHASDIGAPSPVHDVLAEAVVGGADVCSKHSTALISFLLLGVVGCLLSAPPFGLAYVGESDARASGTTLSHSIVVTDLEANGKSSKWRPEIGL